MVIGLLERHLLSVEEESVVSEIDDFLVGDLLVVLMGRVESVGSVSQVELGICSLVAEGIRHSHVGVARIVCMTTNNKLVSHQFRIEGACVLGLGIALSDPVVVLETMDILASVLVRCGVLVPGSIEATLVVG